MPSNPERSFALSCLDAHPATPSASAIVLPCSVPLRYLNGSFAYRPCRNRRLAYWRARRAESLESARHHAGRGHSAKRDFAPVPHGANTPTGQSAELRRSARSRTSPDTGRYMPSGLEPAVELRLGKKRAGRLENLVDSAQFLDLALQRLSRSRSLALSSSRTPESASSRLPHSNRVWCTQSILGASDSTAAQSEGYSPRCSCTIRKARSRTSGENLFVLFMAPSSQKLKPPQKPGRFSSSNSEWITCYLYQFALAKPVCPRIADICHNDFVVMEQGGNKLRPHAVVL